MNRFVKAAIVAMASSAAILAPISLSTASADGWHRGSMPAAGINYGGGWRHGGGWGGPGPYWGGGGGWGYRRHHDHGDAWAAGAIGLAAGAILGGALSQPSYGYAAPGPVYYEQPPVVYYRPVQTQTRYVTRYVNQGSYQPWTRGWYNYCSDRYRSFNPRTGTYVGYDGQSHFCAAN